MIEKLTQGTVLTALLSTISVRNYIINIENEK